MKINGILANIYSFVFQPLLMPFYSIVLLFAYTNFYELYPGQTSRFLFPVLLFTAIVPAIFILLLKKLRMITDYSLTDQKERILPYMMTAFSNAMMIYYFYNSNLYFWFLGLIAAPFIIILAGGIINFFWKISTHMLGIGGLIGSTMSICFNVKGLNPFILFIILIILAGGLGVCRLSLKKNTPAQIYAGFAVGFILAFLSVWFSLYYMLNLK